MFENRGTRFGDRKLKIGILAVQGDFEAHAAMLERLGVETAEVRTAAQL
jgi:glutamine amidotransferase PdxT